MISHFSHTQLFAALWTVAHQAALSMGFSRQEYWSVAISSPSDLPDPGIEPTSLMYPALAGGFLTISTTWEAPYSEQQNKKDCTLRYIFKPRKLACLKHIKANNWVHKSLMCTS